MKNTLKEIVFDFLNQNKIEWDYLQNFDDFIFLRTDKKGVRHGVNNCYTLMLDFQLMKFAIAERKPTNDIMKDIFKEYEIITHFNSAIKQLKKADINNILNKVLL